MLSLRQAKLQHVRYTCVGATANAAAGVALGGAASASTSTERATWSAPPEPADAARPS